MLRTIHRIWYFVKSPSRLVGLALYSIQDHSIDVEEIRRELGEEKPIDSKTHFGKITEVYEAYCIVDSRIYLSFQIIPKLNSLNRGPKVGDSVCLRLSRRGETEEYQVEEFQQIWGRTWEDGEEQTKEYDLNQFEESGLLVKETGVVVRVRGGRMVISVRKQEKSVNMAQVWKMSFLPVKGDLLQLICKDTGDFDGSFIVRAIPLRYKEGDGLICDWWRDRGRISGEVYLDQSVCGYRYTPRLKDLVRYHAVECQPDSNKLHCIWRATSAAPQKLRKHFGKLSAPLSKERLDDHEALLKDKEGIEVTKSLDFGCLNILETSSITVHIKNNGQKEITLETIRLPGRKSLRTTGHMTENEVTWSGPEDRSLSPGTTIEIELTLTAGNIGRDDQLVIFSFGTFSIGRIMSVTVITSALDGVSNCSSSWQYSSGSSTLLRVESQQNWVIRGQKRKRDQPPNYINNRLDSFPVPLFLFEKAENENYSSELVGIYPSLLDRLSPNNYESKLRALLFIEEVAATLELAQYSLDQVAMTRCGPFLSLSVPGLKERRPSLVLGDSVLLANPHDPDLPVYEGCIEEVRATDVLLRFDENFQRIYFGELYNVTFKMNRSQFRRQHQSVLSAEENLGSDILFPNSVHMKTPQVEFIVEDPDRKTVSKNTQKGSSAVKPLKFTGKLKNRPSQLTPIKETEATGHAGGDIDAELWLTPILDKTKMKNIPASTKKSLQFEFKLDENEGSIPAYYIPSKTERQGVKMLKWVNPTLNNEQRSAVLRILSGEGRPYPYIIYGPPGTGKTMTLVEAVLQIFLLHPDARLLVATPSNSAADLVVERLIRSGKVEVGDLARLNSFQRSMESIPEIIHPYCLKNDEDENLLEASRHKILVSTCGTVGSIYKLKLKHGHYTHVFVDEAGHVTEPECLVPLGLVHREIGQIVLAGDPKQLGPVLQSPVACLHGLELSFLERLSCLPVYLPDRERFKDHGGYDPLLVTKLIRNYRSHKDILCVPSRLFYDDELVPCGNVDKIDRFTDINLLPSPGHPVIFHGVKGTNRQEPDSPSWFNPQEVWQVALYAQNLLLAGVDCRDIGIISPYRKQTAKLREMLRILNIDKIKMGSVEEFQGQEMPVIILTTTRSGTEYQDSDNRQGLGFLASPKRLNVAVTRAQALLIVVGNPHVLAQDANWFELLQHIVQVGGYTGCDLPLTLQA